MMDRIHEAHEGGTLYESRITQVPGVPARLREQFGHLDVPAIRAPRRSHARCLGLVYLGTRPRGQHHRQSLEALQPLPTAHQIGAPG